MAIIGIQTNRDNPEYTLEDFIFWLPEYTKFMCTTQGKKYFDKLYKIANNKIYHSIFGTDWEYAMTLCIAHYLQLIANRLQAPAGDSLESIAGGGVTQGVLSSASVGAFSKTYDIDKTMLSDKDSLFWNQTDFGRELMALLATKSVISMMVVTSNPVPGAD